VAVVGLITNYNLYHLVNITESQSTFADQLDICTKYLILWICKRSCHGSSFIVVYSP